MQVQNESVSLILLAEKLDNVGQLTEEKLQGAGVNFYHIDFPLFNFELCVLFQNEFVTPKPLKLDTNSKKTVSFDKCYKYPETSRSSFFARGKALLSKNILRVIRHPG